MGRLLLAVLLAVLPVGGGGAARADSAGAFVRGETDRLVEQFEALARWCTKKKLLRSRNRLYESILHYRPDHETARKWLRYSRDNSGAWVRRRSYREPKDFKPEFVAEFRRRRAAITSGFCDRLLRLFDSAGASPHSRQRILAAVLAADPDHAGARQRNGEVKSRGRWVLRETVTARKRRRKLLDTARAIHRKVPAPERIAPTDLARRLGTLRGARGGRWTGFGTVPASELARQVRVADAVAPVLEAVFDLERAVRSGTFYVGQTAEEYHRMLDAYPEFPADRREHAKKLNGTWLPGGGFLGHNRTPENRLDAVSRMVFTTSLRRSVTDQARQGWIVEGVGFYVSYLLVGTRFTTFVRRTGYAEKREDPLKKMELWRRVYLPNSDWIGLALELHEKGKHADYPFLLSKGLNQMVVEDLVHSYALAAYLIEGRPKKVVALLRSFGQKVAAHKAVGEVLGLTLPALEARVVRWMRERKRS